MNGEIKITIKTFYGFENVLKEELEELGFKSPVILNRAVQISGTWDDIYFLNLYCRCGITVLVEIAKFKINVENDLYKKSLQVDWTSYFDVSKTFAVKGAIYSDIFKHSQFPFLLVKDAIADTFRKKMDDRPDVNVKAPQVLFDVYVNKNEVTISLNTSGAPLFQRGYRQETGEAPLNEVVAAGLIRMTGWDRKSTFIDPFCGSGTILIEAALLASGIPSNIERQHYAFKNFKNFDATKWEEIYNKANVRVKELPCKIIGGDISAEMVMKSRRNLRGLSIGRFVVIENNPFDSFNIPDEKGIMISNPPYGERMGDEIEELYQQVGDWMKNKMQGYTCWLLSANLEAFKFVGLKPDRKEKVFNGDLECSFRKFSIYDGSKKGKYLNLENVEEEE